MLHAAVIVPIVRRDPAKLIFVRRAAHMRRNPGQIAFPGGVVEPGDEDARAAALREFEEELGVPRERVAVVDRLDAVVTLALSVTVEPYVGIVDAPVSFAPDPSEIDSVHEVPLAALYVPGALHRGIEPVERDGERLEIPTWLFDYDGLHVWGATARMLHGLVTRYRDANDFTRYLRAP